MPIPPSPEAFHRVDRYPTRLIETRGPTQAGRLTLRPILPQDAELLAQLVGSLSSATRRNRFHGAIKLSAGHFQQMSHIDYRQHLALVVSTVVDGAEQLIADARYVVEHDGRGAEFALVVADRWQGQGLGAWAMQTLQRAATGAGLQWLHGGVLPDNLPMLGLMQRCGFALSPDAEDDRMVKAQRRLGTQTEPHPGMTSAFRSWIKHIWPAWRTTLQAVPR